MKLRRMATSAKQWVVAHKKPLLIGLAAVTLGSVAGQAIYPHGHAVPFASVAGERVGWQQHADITLMVQDRFSEAEVELVVGEEHKSTERLQSLGATVEANSMAQHVIDYPWVFRLVPFSIVWYQPQLDRYQLSFSDERLVEMSQQHAEELSIEPVDAGLAIEGGELEVTSAEPGVMVEPDALAGAIKGARYTWGRTAIRVPSRTVEPSVSDAAVESVKQRAEAVLDRQISIDIPDQRTVDVERSDIASWLTVEQDASGTLSLDTDEDAMRQYLADLRKDTSIQPTKTVVTTVDGRETDRKPGKEGLGIAIGPLVESISSTLLSGQAVGPSLLAAQMEPIKSPVEYRRSYTSSQAGLSAYVSDVTADGKVQIGVKQLGGDGWSAYGRADESLASASTYKPMLMLRVLDDIKTGKRKWDDRVNGESLSDCFERMIVNSANECPEALIQEYGVTPLTKYLREDKGFSDGTGFTFSKVTQTTARDLVHLMAGIEEASLLDKRHRDMMLEKMSRQIFRQGIPAGSSAPVYNKVGFLWDFLHDAAIVRHPEGVYVLSIMTEGKSWGEVASITRQIEKILYG